MSPTFDEPYRLAQALSYAQSGSFFEPDAHPPFFPWLLSHALPRLAPFQDLHAFRKDPESWRGPYQYRLDRLANLPEDEALIRLRMLTLWIPICTALLLALLARDLGGSPEACATIAVLACLEPAWLGLTSIVTNDTVVIPFLLAGTWLSLRQTKLARAAGCLAFALAWSSKTTAALWTLPLLLGWAFALCPPHVLALFLGAIPLAHGICLAIGYPLFNLSVLPDRVAPNFRLTYLDGVLTLRPQLTYFLQVFINKMSLSLLGLFSFACVTAMRRRQGTFAICMAAFSVGLISCSFFLPGLGWRLTLPLTVAAWLGLASYVRTRLVFLTLTLVLAGEAWWTRDTALAYQNPLAGPDRRMTDSNSDWGQGLKQLVEWRRDHRDGDLALSLFGGTPPETYGMTSYQPLPSFPALPGESLTSGRFSGYVAVSTNHLLGYLVQHPSLQQLAHRAPLTCFAGALCLFDVRDRR